MRVDATPERLRQLIEYRPDTGELVWKPRVPSDFNARNPEAACDAFNRRRAGQIAGKVNRQGYVIVQVDGQAYKGHRIAWAMYHGAWPEGVIDHINRQKADNKIQNLRDVSQAENCENRSINRNHDSGVKGVTWHAKDNMWHVRVRIDGKLKTIFRSWDKPEAIRALIAHRGLSVPIPARSADYAAANGLSDADMAEAVLLFIQAREQEFIDTLGGEDG